MLVALTILLLSNYILAYDGESKLFYDLQEAEEYFTWFMETYNKTYTKYETVKRFEIFKENLMKANDQNFGLDSPVFGINKFTDQTVEEFLQTMTCIGQSSLPDNPNAMTDEDVPTSSNLPDTFDWRQRNVVTSVKNQGFSCKACGAFAATGCVEAAHAKKTGKLVALSEQQLIDCDKQSRGCQGGAPQYAWQSIIKMGGQERLSDYPYKGVNGQCAFDATKVVAKLTTYHSVKIKDEEGAGRQLLVQKGPLSVTVDSTDFHLYKHSGILRCKGQKINHAVLLVGYGSENGVPYWLIKNSWGTDFGENGYVKIQRGVNACGITSANFEYAVA